jgi:carboxymethylenebutenolidase
MEGKPIMDHKIINLYDEYNTGQLDRREFLKKLSILVGGTTAALALLPLIEKNHVKAQIIAKDDSRLNTEYIKYPGETGDVRAYLARPKTEEKLPAVIVIHENKGLQPQIEDVTRRIALEGYLVIGPDALSPLGGTPKEVDKARTLMRELDSQATTKNFVAAVKYLKTNPLSTGKVGCTGFCWGGGMTNQVAVQSPDLAAAAPFYGRQPAKEDVSKIKAALILHYAGLDERINAGIPAFEKALKEASINYKLYMYEGAAHAFFNDSNVDRYHKEAAELAWQRTIAFFKEKLKV